MDTVRESIPVQLWVFKPSSRGKCGGSAAVCGPLKTVELMPFRSTKPADDKKSVQFYVQKKKHGTAPPYEVRALQCFAHSGW